MKNTDLKIGLFSAHAFSKPGGVQKHVIALYREFKKRGITTKIIAPGKHGPQDVPGEDVITIGTSKHIPGNGSRTDIGFSARSDPRKRIRDQQFDILHFHNLGHGTLAFQILLKSKAAHILTVHAAADASAMTKLPLLPLTKLVLQRLYAKKFHGLIGVSPIATEAVDICGGFHNGPTEIIPNGIDLDQFHPAVPQIQRFMDGKKNILFVGRLEKRKGIMYLLLAYEHLTKVNGRNDCRLIVVGDGEMRKEAEGFARSKSLPNVHFEGYVDEAALPSYFATATVFAAPSYTGESFGMNLLEAMACGTPLVGFANPGYAWVMKDQDKAIGESLLAEPKDWLMLAHKIELLMDDESVRRRVIEEGYERCRNFAWPNIADEVLYFYEKVIMERAG